MHQPTRSELTAFLNVFAKLDQFEADHRARTGWGLWNEQYDTLPIPHVVRTIRWLTNLTKEDHHTTDGCNNTSKTDVTIHLTHALRVLYHGVDDDLRRLAENEFSQCSSTQRTNPHELADYLDQPKDTP